MRLSRAGGLYRRLRHVRNRSVIALKHLRHVDPTAYVHSSSHVAADLRAGAYVFVGRDCSIPPLVEIGKYTMLSPRVAIVGDDHNWTEAGVPMQFSGRPPQRQTLIGADVWLGHGVTVIRGAHIGDGAIVAAGAVVTTDIPGYEVWGGVPARRLKSRFAEAVQQMRHESMIAGPLVRSRFADTLESR